MMGDARIEYGASKIQAARHLSSLYVEEKCSITKKLGYIRLDASAKRRSSNRNESLRHMNRFSLA